MKTLFALAFLLGTASWGSFPPKVNVTLIEKMSCREIKRLFQKDRLFVHCDTKTRLVQSFSAEYLGKSSVPLVWKQLRSSPKVKWVEETEGA